jgi:hypothetical protein
VSEEGRTSPVLGEIHDRVVSRGEPLEQLEDELINVTIGLTDDQRAGLWLYAWSLQSPAHQRYEAQTFLRELDIVERND